MRRVKVQSSPCFGIRLLIDSGGVHGIQLAMGSAFSFSVFSCSLWGVGVGFSYPFPHSGDLPCIA